MSRFTPYLGILTALLLAAFVISFSSGVPTARPTTATSSSSASSTLAVLPGLTLPALNPPSPSGTIVPGSTTPSKTTSSSSSPLRLAKPVVQPASSTPIVTQELPPVPAPPVSSGIGLDASASLLRDALVNIICYAPAGSALHSISASGIFIDSKGIILTNAHVAQYFLLADRGVSCVIRGGSPATNEYRAALIYIPSTWIHANAGVLTQAQPSGTGEYDYALLAVTRSTTSPTLPASFPSIPLASLAPAALTPVVIATYGAQFLDTAQVQSSLFPTIVFGSVKKVYTFENNTADLLALGGSAAAQEGSSGGGVADANGQLVGTITTSTIEGSTDTRSLNAISASYIRGDYASTTGSALDLLLNESIGDAISSFAPQMPALEAVLTAGLQQN